MINIPFSPVYDSCYPVAPEHDGVFCVVCDPLANVKSVYIKRDTKEIMDTLGCRFRLLKMLDIYHLDNEVDIMHSKEYETDSELYPILINGRAITDICGTCIICGRDFTDLPMNRALEMLNNTKLRQIFNDVCVCIDLTR